MSESKVLYGVADYYDRVFFIFANKDDALKYVEDQEYNYGNYCCIKEFHVQ